MKPNNKFHSRQDFIDQSKAGLVAGSLLASKPLFSENNLEKKTFKVGLIGCGGRGSGAALNTLMADSNVELVAMADVFEERLKSSLSRLKSNKKVGAKVKVDVAHQFIGLDSFTQLLKTDIDIVILATPPAFRPYHLKAAIDAGKHVFAEKPIAVDQFGVQMARLASEEAEKKKCFVVAGLQTRYEPNSQQMVKMIQGGAIGDIVSLNTVRFQGAVKMKYFPKSKSEVAKQIGNWLNFTWLSGDSVVEFFVHEIDRLSWILGGIDPVCCYATGGKQQPANKYIPSQVYDHLAATIEYPNGVKMNISTRKQLGAELKWTMDVGGSKGYCQGIERKRYTFSGKTDKVLEQNHVSGHELEHVEMYRALRAGEYINNGSYHCHSTLIGIMVREAAYSGKEIKWKDMQASQTSIFDVSQLSFESTLPKWKVAVPGMHGII
jgi:predicted dehydrogenase